MDGPKFTKIKTVGLINNVYAIVLEDDSILTGIQNIKLEKNGDTNYGILNLQIILNDPVKENQ